MAKSGLGWDELRRILKARSRASQAVEVLEETAEGATPIKKEVSAVCNNTKRSDYNTASYYCNDSGSHSINYMREAERHTRGRRGDSSRDVAHLLHREEYLLQGEV